MDLLRFVLVLSFVFVSCMFVGQLLKHCAMER